MGKQFMEILKSKEVLKEFNQFFLQFCQSASLMGADNTLLAIPIAVALREVGNASNLPPEWETFKKFLTGPFTENSLAFRNEVVARACKERREDSPAPDPLKILGESLNKKFPDWWNVEIPEHPEPLSSE